MTDHLAIDCPKCKAPAGQKCKNYLGRGKAPCRERLPEKARTAQAWRRAAHKAARLNRAEAEALPLLARAGLLPPTTARDVYRGPTPANPWCGLTEYEGGRLLDDLRLHQVILPFARSQVSAEAFARLDAHCRRTYPCADYHYGFWRGVLTGERVELRLEEVVDRKPGQPAVACTDWYERRHMSREEFHARFPYAHAAPPGSGFEAAGEAVLATIRKGGGG